MINKEKEDITCKHINKDFYWVKSRNNFKCPNCEDLREVKKGGLKE